jgi:hypothetical protein
MVTRSASKSAGAKSAAAKAGSQAAQKSKKAAENGKEDGRAEKTPASAGKKVTRQSLAGSAAKVPKTPPARPGVTAGLRSASSTVATPRTTDRNQTEASLLSLFEAHK